VEVPDLQGTDSGPRAHLRRGSEPPGRAIILSSRPTILNFYLSSRSGSRELQSGEARADVFPELGPQRLPEADGAGAVTEAEEATRANIQDVANIMAARFPRQPKEA
jgi:hypothetical protein